MNSINKNQEGDHHDHLQGEEAVEKIKELADGKTCFFCTAIRNGQRINSRPMSVQKTDESGNLWFLVANDSNTYFDISKDPNVHLFFKGSDHADFLSLYGSATLSADKDTIEALWEPLLKTWFTEGKDDPRIAVIQVTPREAYYWDNKHGNAVALLKVIAGAITGKTMDDSVEGEVNV